MGNTLAGAGTSFTMHIIRKYFCSKRVFCNRLSQSSLPFLLRPFCELFCVIQISHCTFSHGFLSVTLSLCSDGQLESWGFWKYPWNYPKWYPTPFVALPWSFLSQTENQRSQQLPNWIWSISSTLQCRSKHACNGYSFIIPASYLRHLFAFLFLHACLLCFSRTPVSDLMSARYCFMECLCQGWPHRDDKIYQLGWLVFIKPFTRNFHEQSQEIKRHEWRANRRTAWMSD